MGKRSVLCLLVRKIYSLERGYRGYHVQTYNVYPFAETFPPGQRK